MLKNYNHKYLLSDLFLFLLRSSLSRSSLSRQHGNNFIVDNFILSLYLGKNFINFSLALFINSWDDKHEDPGHGEESEGVEHGSDESSNIQEQSKLASV